MKNISKDYLLLVVVVVSDQYQSSEISSVTVSSVITGDIGSANTSKSEKSSRGCRIRIRCLPMEMSGVQFKGFNIDQQAPGTVYDSNQLYFTNPHLNKRLCKKVEGPCAVAMDAILATAFKFQILVWPTNLNMQNSIYS